MSIGFLLHGWEVWWKTKVVCRLITLIFFPVEQKLVKAKAILLACYIRYRKIITSETNRQNQLNRIFHLFRHWQNSCNGWSIEGSNHSMPCTLQISIGCHGGLIFPSAPTIDLQTDATKRKQMTAYLVYKRLCLPHMKMKQTF